jgi:hypothetical protein
MRRTSNLTSSHSTTVPSIWKKGRPTDVCQFWGDFLYVAREGREQRKARQEYWDVSGLSAALTGSGC